MIARTLVLACTLSACLFERDPPPCQAPRPLGELNTTVHENNPSLTQNRLEIVFQRNDPDPAMLYHASRASAADAFANITPLPYPSGINNAFDPWIAGDGSKLWFVTGGTSGGDVYEATRAESLPGNFDTANAKLVFTELGQIVRPSLSDDELEIAYAAPNLGTHDPMDLWFARRPSTNAAFAKPTTDLADVDGGGFESGTSLSGDGQHLVYDTTSVGLGGYYRIASATRSGDTFMNPETIEIPDPQDNENDESPWAAPDGRTIVFASDRPGGVDGLDLWIYCE